MLTLPFIQFLEPIVRYGEFNVSDIAPNPDEPVTWDRKMLLIGLLTGLTEGTLLKVEYYILDETTGLGEVKNNQLLINLNIEIETVVGLVQ